MNNKIFIDRCETLFVTIKSGNYSSVTTQKVADILEIEAASALQFVNKVISFNMLVKCGGGRNTVYKLSADFHNSLKSSMENLDLINGVKKTVAWFISHPKEERAKEITLPNGKRLIKVESKKVDVESQHAIDCVLSLVNSNKELKAENELLKEEIERLKKYEEYYKQINKIKL